MRNMLTFFRLVPVLLLAAASTAGAQEEASQEAATFSELYEHPSRGKEAFVLKRDIFELSINPRLQIQAAPYVGDDALIENGDVATNEGIRVRRASIGLYAKVKDRLKLSLASYLYDELSGGNALVNASLAYTVSPYASLALGTAPLPFSAGSIVSSVKLQLIERPFGTQQITPRNQLGFSCFGQLPDGLLEYGAGMFNGYEGYSKGDMGKGFLYAGRVQASPFGTMDPGESDYEISPLRVAVGADYFYSDDSSIITHAASTDIHLKWKGFSFKGEFLYDRRTPEDMPEFSPSLPDATRRMGFYAQSGFFLLKQVLEAAIRYEWYDNNLDTDDTGDIFLLTGGINLFLLDGYLKTQLNYIHRGERTVRQLQNDTLVLQCQVNL